MQENETLAYKKIVPATHTLEGLYIDDHLVMQILPKRKIRKSRSKFKDEELIEQSRKKYEEEAVYQVFRFLRLGHQCE